MPKFNVTKKRGKAKVKVSEKRKAMMARLADAYSEEFDVKMSVIQELIPLAMREVTRELQLEVVRLAGEKHSRGGDKTRWGSQDGSIYLRDQKFGIRVPRVRDTVAGREIPLKTYQRLRDPFDDDQGALRRLLHGLSTHKYHENSSLAAETFGLSASSLSQRFKKGSAKKLQDLQRRSLSGHDFVAIFIDAKRYADDGIMAALGVTMDGGKVVLGVEQTHTENGRAIEQWLDRLIERGLKFEDGLLFIVDGSKGIRKAIGRKFGPYALVQRCRWHKRENVVSYLSEADQTVVRRRMQEAYAKTTYEEAAQALAGVHRDLERINESAANSLLEGLEETLTIHQLGLSAELSTSLATTNCIESFLSQVGAYTDKVDRWHNSNQILRWTATSALDIEPRLRKIKGFRYLGVLRSKMQEIVKERLRKNAHQKFSTQDMIPSEIVEYMA